MPKLKDLKAAATSKLGSVDSTVMTYISTLEGKVRLNAVWVIGGFVVGLAFGWFVRGL